MEKHQRDLDVRPMFRSWLFDLHRAGRAISIQAQREVEQIAALVVASGGSLEEAFSAARSILVPLNRTSARLSSAG